LSDWSAVRPLSGSMLATCVSPRLSDRSTVRPLSGSRLSTCVPNTIEDQRAAREDVDQRARFS
jgi:hypothetical protein